jgi:hypothetical protein
MNDIEIMPPEQKVKPHSTSILPQVLYWLCKQGHRPRAQKINLTLKTQEKIVTRRHY